MAFKIADRVKETSITAGAGTLNLAGAVTDFQTFVNGIGSGNQTIILIDDGAGNWEVCYSTITSGTPATASRGTLIASSTGSRVSFGGVTKTVACVVNTAQYVYAGSSAVLAETAIASASTCDLGSIQTLRANVTGTTGITGFGTQPNSWRIVRYSSALVLTHNASSLILLGGVTRTVLAGEICQYVSDGSGNWREITTSATISPTRQVLTSGTTYTTPAGVKQLRIRMVGGGGGGGSGGSVSTQGTAGATGGTTTFNSIQAAGGVGGNGGTSTGNVFGGAGGTGGTGAASFRSRGGGGAGGVVGASGSQGASGGAGGSSCLGGGGNGAGSGSGVTPGYGGGGGGADVGGEAYFSGAGGGGGEYVELIINNPASTYTYAIGAAGAAGAAARGGNPGNQGVIIVDEIY